MTTPVTLCRTCRHWLPKETPRWAARMGMAVCALKQTKAVTMASWTTCRKHLEAEPKVVAARVLWLKPAEPVSSTTEQSH